MKGVHKQMPRKADSPAVMARRNLSKDGLDDFPTPKWATRALFEYVMGNMWAMGRDGVCRVLEPCAGRGIMADVIKEYLNEDDVVDCWDVKDYGYPLAKQQSIMMPGVFSHIYHNYDWVITNPPFKFAEPLAIRLRPAIEGGTQVALLCRSVFAEGINRYTHLFSKTPPDVIAIFAERVGMVEGRLDEKVSSATSYSWFLWLGDDGKLLPKATQYDWIPPCKKRLTKADDYDMVEARVNDE